MNHFLQHLNSQQLAICFTTETEKDNKIAFLDTLVLREPNGCPTSDYRKPTHTDQYLVHDSHHSQSVKHSIVKCLYDWVKHLVTKPEVISKEKKHLSLLFFILYCFYAIQGETVSLAKARGLNGFWSETKTILQRTVD